MNPTTIAWLLLLLAAATAVLSWWHARRHTAWLVQVIGPRPAAARSATGGQGVRRFLPATAVLLLAAAVGFAPDQGAASRRGADLVICLDVSRSMLARDGDRRANQSRLSRAAQDIRVLCGEATGDRIALVLFAGSAVERVPPTGDLDTLAEIATTAAPEDVARSGTDLAAPLELAAGILRRIQSADRVQAVLLITDGEDPDLRGRDAAQRLEQGGIQVHCIGVGTTGGAKIPIPTADGGETFLQDDAGRDVVTALVPEGLRQLAAAGGGGFLQTGPDTNPVLAAYRSGIMARARELALAEDGAPSVTGGRNPWWLLLAIVCGALAALPRKTRPATQHSAPHGLQKNAQSSPVAPPSTAPGTHRSPRHSAALLLITLLPVPLTGCADQRPEEAANAWRRGDLRSAAAAWGQMAEEGLESPMLQVNLAMALVPTGSPDAMEFATGAATADPVLAPAPRFVAGLQSFLAGRIAARETLKPAAPPEAYDPAIRHMAAAANAFADAAALAVETPGPWTTSTADQPAPHWPTAIRNAERAARITAELRRMRALAAQDRQQVSEQQRQALLQMLGTEGEDPPQENESGTGEGEEVAPETAPDPAALDPDRLQALLERLANRELEKRRSRREQRDQRSRATGAGQAW